MRGLLVLGGFALGLLACSAGSSFACSEDSQCSLTGAPGMCVAGNCAYPSDACESGYAYPDGAPGNLGGMCADVEDPGTGSSSGSDVDTGPSASTGTSDATTSTGGTTVALDGTATGDDTTTSSSGDTSGTGESSSSSGSCVGFEVFLEPQADTFMADDCPMAGCNLFNYGSTSQHEVGSAASGERYVMAMRFDIGEIIAKMPSMFVSAELELFSEVDGQHGGTLEVSMLGDEPAWIEGMQSGDPAEMGESCWDFAQFDKVPWPGDGPPSAAVAELGEVEVEDFGPGDPIVIPLDATVLMEELMGGADSLLIHGQVQGVDLYSRESMTPPQLRVVAC